LACLLIGTHFVYSFIYLFLEVVVSPQTNHQSHKFYVANYSGAEGNDFMTAL